MIAVRPPVPAPPALTGPQRAAAILMLLGDEHGAELWRELSEPEVKAVCLAMTELGAMRGEEVESIMTSFMGALGRTGALLGSADRAEEILSKVFPAERVAAVMSDIRGVSGRQVWRRLEHVTPAALASMLRNEYAQTIAVVLSRLGADQGGKVLALLPDRLAADVVERMLGLGEVRPEALEDIENMLYRHFFGGAAKKLEPDRFEVMADRFNALDRPTEARFLAALEANNSDAAQRIREKMFTFDDLLKLDAAGAQTLLRNVDKDVLARALKGAKQEAKDFFLTNMSTRAAKNLQDDMEAMGPVRMKDVDDAQAALAQAAKALAVSGEIRIVKGRSDEDVVV